ncbi:MAG TPA: hypothetical protein VGZ48_01960 [Candidatus Acidoferrales bacterium]|nr:hypothetical protein [Candidatus Acidoferrales bacterium]
MILQLTGDEAVLAIIALVRAIDPKMLKMDGDGFTVDFTQLAAKNELSDDEQLLIKLRVGTEETSDSLELTDAEAQRLASRLERLELSGTWPEDVVTMSRSLRSRLTPAV